MKRTINFYLLILFFCTLTILAQTPFNNVVDFDGNGDFANTFNNPYLPTVKGTLEAWIKVKDFQPPGNLGDVFFAKNEEQWNVGDFYAYLEYGTGYLYSRIQYPPSLEIDVRTNNSFWQYINNWVHYAFTWGSGGMKTYINGVLQNDQNGFSYPALNTTYNIYVGAHGYMLHNGSYVVSGFFNGQIDELRIWNFKKNSQQITALMNSPLESSYYLSADSGLVGYWKFDILEDLGINNDGADDVRDFSILQNHLDFAGNTHLVPSDLIVPVELVSFTGKVVNEQILLEWVTSTEVNNLGFEIERCTQEDNWRTIAFINGQGTSTELHTYSFVDDLFSSEPGMNYYRLKQIDFNGHFEYSNEIEVNVPLQDFTLYQNYPNPFNSVTVIKYSIPKTTHIFLIVYDSLGQKIRTLVDELKIPGFYQIEFDATELPSGIYFFSLLSMEHSSTQKMILMK